MKKRITAIIGAAAVIFSACAKSESTDISGKWTEQNRLYTYEFDDSGNVLIDTLSYQISGKYELNGEYDLILHLDPQGNYADDEPVSFGFDLKKTSDGYEMDYHPMDQNGSMPYEPISLATGYSSAIWSNDPIMLTAYNEVPPVQQSDIIGFWKDPDDSIKLFTEDNIYSTGRTGLISSDAIIKDGTAEMNGGTVNAATDGEKLAISDMYGTEIYTRWQSDNMPLTGIFMLSTEDGLTELRLKDGVGIGVVRNGPSPSDASVNIDGTNITIKTGGKTVSGIFCPADNTYSGEDKFGYYNGGCLPYNYYILTDENSDATLTFDVYTLSDSQFNEWYNAQ